MPAASPVVSTEPERDGLRTKGGQFTRRGAALAGKAGGVAVKGARSIAGSLGLRGKGSKEWESYRRKAASYRRAHCRYLAHLCGGMCSSGPSALVGSAAREIARSLFLTDQAEQETAGSKRQLELFAEARKQEDSARSNLLHAYSLAALEAKAFGQIAKPYDLNEAERRAKVEAADKLALIKRKPARGEQEIIETEGEPA